MLRDARAMARGRRACTRFKPRLLSMSAGQGNADRCRASGASYRGTASTCGCWIARRTNLRLWETIAGPAPLFPDCYLQRILQLQRVELGARSPTSCTLGGIGDGAAPCFLL